MSALTIIAKYPEIIVDLTTRQTGLLTKCLLFGEYNSKDKYVNGLARAILILSADASISCEIQPQTTKTTQRLEIQSKNNQNILDSEQQRFRDKQAANGAKGGAPKGNKNALKKTTQTTQWLEKQPTKTTQTTHLVEKQPKNNPNNPDSNILPEKRSLSLSLSKDLYDDTYIDQSIKVNLEREKEREREYASPDRYMAKNNPNNPDSDIHPEESSLFLSFHLSKDQYEREKEREYASPDRYMADNTPKPQEMTSLPKKHADEAHLHGASDFMPPTREEVREYIIKIGAFNVDADAFYDNYEKNNWIDKLGKLARNWKQKVKTWEWYGKKYAAERAEKDRANFREQLYNNTNPTRIQLDDRGKLERIKLGMSLLRMPEYQHWANRNQDLLDWLKENPDLLVEYQDLLDCKMESNVS